MAGTLYLVATPIGNLGDMTYRAVEVLRSADVIACEDTRHSRTLLDHYGIKKPLVSYHKFNERTEGEKLCAELEGGRNVALISDAGMPLISDPGSVLTEMCREREIAVTVIPGPNAGLCALVLSGLDAGAFSFFGFLPKDTKGRRELAERFRGVRTTLIFYTPPHGIREDLDFLYRELGARRYAAVREITKVYESVERGVLGEPFAGSGKGEYVLVVEGAQKAENPMLNRTAEEHLACYLEAGMDRKEAVKRVAKERGVTRNEIYQITLEAGKSSERS